MHWMSFLYGGMSNDGNKRGAGWQMRNRPGEMCIVRNMRIHLPGFGNFPGTIKIKIQKHWGGKAPRFMVKTVANAQIKYNTYTEKQKG